MQETLIMIVVMAIPKYIYVHEKVHERLKGQGLCTPGDFGVGVLNPNFVCNY